MTQQIPHPESLVDTAWVAEHMYDSNVVLVEVDVDLEAFAQGHISGALHWDWTSHLNAPVPKHILSREQMEQLLGESGHR